MKESDFIERQISSELIYDGIVLHLYRDEIEQSTGTRSIREIIRHNGAVCVVPVTNDRRVLCVKQYRYAHAKTMIEIPAGKLDSKDEDPESAARRELREETGYTAEKYTFIGELYPSPAILSENIHMFIATGLKKGEQDLDEDEFLDVVKLPFAEVVQMILDNKITDAKTQTAVLKAKLILGL